MLPANLVQSAPHQLSRGSVRLVKLESLTLVVSYAPIKVIIIMTTDFFLLNIYFMYSIRILLSLEFCLSGGIFKETEVGAWVHLVCALYVPGVAFSEVHKKRL